MRKFFIGYALILLSITAIFAQDGSAMRSLIRGDSLRITYRFEEALALYEQVAALSLDTLLQNKAELNKIFCENGLNMLQYAVDLKVLGSATIPRESFYLYLNSDSRNFWAFPNRELFPNLSDEYPAFVSQHNKTIIFTGKSEGSQKLDLYISRQSGDSLWSYPVLMGSAINSDGNECYPVLSTDGQTLFFASDGHYGMGEFDLYMSRFDENSGKWSQASNMGFPYSSTENDIAFMPSPDGLTALLISDRGAFSLQESQNSQGSLGRPLFLYSVEYELNPERHDWRNKSDLFLLSQLKPNAVSSTLRDNLAEKQEFTKTASEWGGIFDYTQLVQTAKKIKDEVISQEKKLTQSREAYSRLISEEERLSLAQQIEKDEMLLIELQEKYRLAGVAVQRVETDFLQKGIFPSFSPPAFEECESNPAIQSFPPPLGRLGTIESFVFAAPINIKDPIDISFRIGIESQLVTEQEWSLPNYLFYQIQIAVLSDRADPISFNGISPIFEYRTTKGKYLYAAGQFNNYSEASKALTQVQKAGFKSAVILSYNLGKSVELATARKVESSIPKAMYRISLGSYPSGIPTTLSDAIKEFSNKDLARVTGTWGSKYVIGPFSTMQEAQALQKSLTELGFKEIIVEITPPYATTPSTNTTINF